MISNLSSRLDLFSRQLTQSLEQLFKRDDGSQLVEVACVLPLLLLVFVGAVDFGRAYFFRLEVDSAAEVAAFYALLNPGDTDGIRAAAALDSPDLPNLTASSTSGAECSDGSNSTSQASITPQCSISAVRYIEVTTTASYSPILRYPGIPTSVTLIGKSRMRSAY